MFPSIEPSVVGNTGLLWLFLSYGYILYRASGLISEGSELLLLVPSLAGLVGGVVLPLLGAVPDGAIMLFSGLGDIESAQETLSVGVGALAGSTIMLLTIPWSMSILAGKVNLIPRNDGSGKLVANYKGEKKLSPGRSIYNSGVAITSEVKHGAFVMLLTTIPYFLIQFPASYLERENSDNIAKGEKLWALLALVVCITGFLGYLFIHFKASREDEQKFRRMEVMKNMLQTGKLSLGGVFYNLVKTYDGKSAPIETKNGQYQSIDNGSSGEPSPQVMEYLKSVLSVSFQKYDLDGNATLGKNEVRIFLKDFHEDMSEEELDVLFTKYDKDHSGSISLDEFVLACYSIVTAAHMVETPEANMAPEESLERGVATAALGALESSNGKEEEEEMPDDIAKLSPEKQEAAVKKKAFTMLTFGTFLVLLFSDPMVDVMQEIAVRVKISPFYVSFILAPLASNASEVIASAYYASKKTTKTITVSFSALEGAAAMNNTFCLSIFMGLIFFRGLAWQYTAETISIVLVQIFIYVMTLKDVFTVFDGLMIITVFPLSIVLIASLEALGFD
mmetsp:Transcript_7885/g.14858  ORF Transcript_7885/g.14858 Transcript_7885/m.14858 type:complete len:562 (-) Transcript_7885:115-1800(-)